MCFHQDSIYPSAVELPQMRVAYSLNAQLMWLKQEAAELCQVGLLLLGTLGSRPCRLCGDHMLCWSSASLITWFDNLIAWGVVLAVVACMFAHFSLLTYMWCFDPAGVK